MSLGDYLRLRRAQRGGITPLDIETALPELTKGCYRQIEQRYRAVGDDESIRLIAGFYDMPFEELRWRLDWPRKALSRALVQALIQETSITLYLWNHQVVAGQVKWWDLGAVELETPDGPLVVQRHAIERWDPRAPEDAAAETVSSSEGDAEDG